MGMFWIEEFIDGWLESRVMIKASNLTVARRKAERLQSRNGSDLRIIKNGIIVARKASSKWDIFD